MKKRFLALLLCAIMLAATVPSALAEDTSDIIPISNVLPFDDVGMDSPFYEVVVFAYDNGIMNGIGEDEFGPDLNMTRGMFATIVGRHMGVDPSEHGWLGEESFADVASDEWYAPYIAWAASLGIINGVGDSLYDPDGFVTREQMYVILARYADKTTGLRIPGDAGQAVFADEADISDWARGGVDAMRAAGVLACEEGHFLRPQEFVTRAEIAAVFAAFDAAIRADAGAETALKIAQHLISAELDEAYAMFNADVKDEVDALGGMEAFYAQIIAVTGELLTCGDVTYSGSMMGYDTYYVQIVGGNGVYSLVVMLDAEGDVGGLAVTLSEESVDPPRDLPEGFVAEEVVVDAGTGYPLGGTVVRPANAEESLPAVLLVQGSGASARDQVAGVNRIFDQIAAGLAERGIASLRFDKRTWQYPEVAMDLEFTVQQEYVEDVLAAVELLGQQPGVDADRIYILGHSQGGMLAPMLIDAGANACGMIFLAGSPRDLMDIADDQLRSNIAYYDALGMTEMRDMVDDIAREYGANREALEKMTEDEAKASELELYGYNAYYMYTLSRYDAMSTIKKLAVPTLILQGSNDHQVYADVDFEIYKTELANEDYVSFKLYEGLSHAFFPSQAASLVESSADYLSSKSIPEEVFDDIAEWMGA